MGAGKPLPDLLQQTRKTLGEEVLTVSRTAYRARLKSVTRAIPGESSDWPRSLHRDDPHDIPDLIPAQKCDLTLEKLTETTKRRPVGATPSQSRLTPFGKYGTGYAQLFPNDTRALEAWSSDLVERDGDDLALCRYGVAKPGPTRFLSDPPAQLRSFPLVAGFVQRGLGSRCIG
jgi:hypothetical protein